MSDIFVTGGDGQLGMSLQEIAPEFNYLSIKDLDVTDKSAIEKLLKAKFVINLAAYTAVDKAESEKPKASAVNAMALAHISRSAKSLIHISTDYVFDGEKKSSYTEEDMPNPINHYGASKRAGEMMALNGPAESIVLRSSWLFSPYQSNFVKRMLELSQTKDELRIVSDQIGCPTSCLDLSRNILMLIDRWETAEQGLYHFANSGECSWFELAQKTLEIKGIQTPVVAITSDQYPTPARRPKRSVLNCDKFINTFGIQIQTWQDALKEVVDRL